MLGVLNWFKLMLKSDMIEHMIAGPDSLVAT
jgi:hypothetical protein